MSYAALPSSSNVLGKTEIRPTARALLSISRRNHPPYFGRTDMELDGRAWDPRHDALGRGRRRLRRGVGPTAAWHEEGANIHSDARVISHSLGSRRNLSAL